MSIATPTEANLKNYCRVLRTSEILFSSLFLSEISVIRLTDNRAWPSVVRGPRVCVLWTRGELAGKQWQLERSAS